MIYSYYRYTHIAGPLHQSAVKMTDGTRGPAGSIKTSRRKTNRRRLNGFNYVRSRDSARFDTSYAGRIRYNIIIPNNSNNNSNNVRWVGIDVYTFYYVV